MVKIGPRRRISTGQASGPVKKALLIAINYDNAPQDSGYGELLRPRQDAKEFAELLISKYEYARGNVLLMLDEEGGDPRFAPTRDNILREIRRLVYGARSGDHFLFYYAGHSGQVESPSTEEDDGMDECMVFTTVTFATNSYTSLFADIVPVDHWGYPSALLKKRMILDNKLRKLLVDTLPIGANLTAIFDSCHSGTLLDLDHYLCHSVYYPWVSPGFRYEKTMWRRVRRRNDQRMTQAEVKVIKKNLSRSARASRQNSTASQSSRQASTASVRIYQRKRVSQDEVLVFNTSVGIVDSENGKTREFSIVNQPRRAVKRRRNTTLSMLLEACGSEGSLDKISQRSDTMEDLDLRMCSSPTDMMTCNGFCEPKPDLANVKPNVISLSACRDEQETWESKRHSFTQVLIGQLKRNAHPPLKQLVESLTFNMNKNCRKLHHWSRQEWENLKKIAASTPPESQSERDAPEALTEEPASEQGAQQAADARILELENFSEPQLGSLRTLTLQETFDP
ncbi:hypothetical protein PYCCODRAFT_1465490 [Trametes coccinea BRFM310]|uniref:Peptidase C14 caspase domain-containing protein n=1 Tax=Trametes coccinea (strain BRFM310) TaxID=1353009 RepID=A0A1Y2IWQ9_TRAC3|nr:hypothetical protein PYCCODRAFT_1465490 [Trametes coccinea BRFM310]